MRDILAAIPAARDLLFERYHFGGCATCSYQPEETLAEVCARFNTPEVAQVISCIHRALRSMWAVLPPGFTPRLTNLTLGLD